MKKTPWATKENTNVMMFSKGTYTTHKTKVSDSSAVASTQRT